MNIFKKLFGKNNEIENKPLEEVKMKIKVTKSEPLSFGNVGTTMSSGTTIMSKQMVMNKDPVYISIRNQNIIKHPKLKYIDMSKKTGFPIYEVLGNDMSFLVDYPYSEVLLNKTSKQEQKNYDTRFNRGIIKTKRF